MANYRVLAKTWLQPDGYTFPIAPEIGATVSYSGTPGSALEPMDRAAEDAYVRWAADLSPAMKGHRRIAARVDAIKAARAEEAKRAA
jgi:hypothetical protein